VAPLLDTLQQLVINLGTLVWELVLLLAPWLLLIAWVAWWLWAVNWKRAWVVLAEGAWAPVVLLMILAAHVWASLDPGGLLPGFWWKLGGVCLVVGGTLLCGWLQVVLNWSPAEINLEPPPPAAHGHHH
jgi:hypothetical protein